ncbi:bifunctional ADP-dependent NAD(P)H-hydrate dehydratase/NAD(P)H-hydrate epimerase [Corynebacterium bovis]|uniref:bifunctional ADP-dependent NAD(P)H-hydrate dehydratase/NAD(P)H-hydrate epimerase n=1 Tax=Corynebacterium bovis TaxID=36808 RepID=UPI001FD03E57|nr:bifunctional ADP-dependent NAD(P)H-hydrate dehydratase/NAD(P)H-hydrate epimerase [Corynebacterium bovis]
MTVDMPGAGEGRRRGTTAPSAVNGPVYSVAAVRAAEEPLLRGAGGPPEDGLMRRAARAVAEVALAVLPTPASGGADADPTVPSGVLVLAGPGGNGGDALYAAATLADAGHPVTAVAVGRDGATHPRATAAARAAGVRVAAAADILPTADDTARPPRFALVIDGIAGIGHARPLDDDAAALAALGPVLAVDAPSGVDADTGHAPGAHVTAAVTVTFGVRRVAHVTSDACGRVLVADIGLAPGLAAVADEHRPVATALSGWEPRPTWPGPAGGPGSGPAGGPSAFVVDPAVVPPERRAPVVDIRPGATSDKYSGGVVGVLAGSAAYPGAGVLATTGAVRATPSMVRYVGSGRDEIVRALPEVVAVSGLDDCGRVQAWVVGPGRGTGQAEREELAALLDRPEPLVVDADALTLLAGDADLRRALTDRDAPTVLTPHAGEFARLAPDLPVDGDRLGAARALARRLGVIVLLKGRFTVVTDGTDTTVVDSGTSWSATPGSGDVLSGILGALVAGAAGAADTSDVSDDTAGDNAAASDDTAADRLTAAVRDRVVDGVRVHAVAAALSATHPEGEGPTSASLIAASVPRAWAWLHADPGAPA